MRNSLLVLICLLIATTAVCQINLSVQLPSGGYIEKKQLWNIVLINAGPALSRTQIKMSVQDVRTGQIVLAGYSGYFMCPSGVKVITNTDVQPVIYNFSSPDMSRNYLPLGTYILCYRVIAESDKGEEPQGEDCITMNVDPLSPPLLNVPQQQEKIFTSYPQFAWIPPMPFDLFNNLSYELMICEVSLGQQPIEAIQYNIPVLHRALINQPFYNYGSSHPPLKKGSTYAWQVTATNGLDYAIKTDVWWFIVEKDSIAEIISTAPYVDLDIQSNSVSIAHQGMLKFKFRNTLSDSTATFNIYSGGKDGESQTLLKTFKLPIYRGEIFFSYDLPKHSNLKSNEVYELICNNSEGRLRSMRFMIKYY
jgi:hypothetical protein